VKVQFGGIVDTIGPVPLLGLSEVLEGGTFPEAQVAPGPWPRASFTGLFNPTTDTMGAFTPTPSPNRLP
jgi:hypothetical protein